MGPERATALLDESSVLRGKASITARLTPQQQVQHAVEVLDAVRHAADDSESATSLSRAKTAVRNFLEQGRSVTWALQHLKSQAPDDWDEWWKATTQSLREDPVAQW